MAAPRVLIVDDDLTITAILQRLLTGQGYRVETAGHGAAALERLGQEPAYDVVLLDRQMPGMDGLEVLRQMKQDPLLRDIPVVLQTAMGREEEVLEGFQAGARHYLLKPIDTRLVVKVVQDAVEEFATRRRLRAEMDGLRQAMGLLTRGVFQYQTFDACQGLAALLAQACPDPRRSAIGLSELLVNALEHGNLGITYEEKSTLIEAHAWQEEVLRRQGLPENRAKWVRVAVSRTSERVRFRIQDQGKGFPWQDYLEVRTERLFDSHGRGILLAKWEAFDRITYVGNGSCVIAEVDVA